MKSVTFLIDNLRIGGFQRLCLDQAYAFSDKGYKVTIIVLQENDKSSPSFLTSECELIAKSNLQIVFVSNSHFKQLITLLRLVKNLSSNDILVSHSLRATALLRLSFMLDMKKPLFTTTIHQLPTLSAAWQRFKRFTYAQLSPNLTAYSIAVKSDWESRISKFPIGTRFLFSKDISVLRNGIYLPRIANNRSGLEDYALPRLIFLGRLTSWKGFTTFLNFGRNSHLSEFRLLLIVPAIPEETMKDLKQEFGNRIEFVIGQSFDSYSPIQGDVHFYAAEYGEDAMFIESISLNCLEMASVGTPSVVTIGGLETWPDLVDLGLFYECNWNDVNSVVSQIFKASNIRIKSDILQKIRETISIESNIVTLESLRLL